MDRCLDLDSTEGTKTDVIVLSAEWTPGSVTVAEYTGDFTIGAATTGTISSNGTPISVTYANAGETSDYVFSFSVDTDLADANEIWIAFPDNYDPNIGEAA